MTTPTPRPWKIGYRDVASNELVITDDDSDEGDMAKMIPVARVQPQPHYKDSQGSNAALIVHCINTYPALVEALEATLQALRHAPLEGCYGKEARYKAEAVLTLAKKGLEPCATPASMTTQTGR